MRIATIVALLAAAISAQAEVVKLDFGTSKSPVRPGFAQVTEATEFTDGQVAGWAAKGAVISVDKPVKRGWTFRKSSGRNYPPRVYTSNLSQDHVESADAATLRIRLANGTYRLWVLAGHAGGRRSQVWDIQVAAGGQRAAATFPGGDAVRKLELTAAVTQGALDVHFTTRSRWFASALVVAPAAQWDAVRKDTLDAAEDEVFFLPPDVLKKWKERPHEDNTPMPKFTDEQRKVGLVTYHRPWSECIWPNTVPTLRDIAAPVRAFAARDDYEPMTITILPLRDFDPVDVEVTDLRTREGKAISSEDISVRCVRYMVVRPNYTTQGAYYRAPDVLVPMEPRPLVKHENFRVWLTVYVDAFATDGIYTGEARIKAAGRVVAAVPLKLRVLPFKLEKDRSIVYGQYYHHPYGNMRSAPDAFSRRWWRHKAEAEHADMAAHGNNAITMGLGGHQNPDGSWTLNYDYIGMCIDLARRHGFYQPQVMSFPASRLYWKYMHKSMGSHMRLVEMPPPKYFDEVTELVRIIETERKRRQWPEFLYYPVDEPSTQPASVAFMTEVLKAIKRVPGVRTYVTADPTHDQFDPMRPYVDVWCCQPFNPERKVILEDMNKRGVTYWCYPNHVAGENDHTTVTGARMTYGFGLWRSGFRALIPWIYQAVCGDQWNYLDSSAMDFFNRTADDGSPIAVTMWEAYREGIDDGRFITTLDRWIERAKAAGLKDEAAQAERDRKFVWDAIQVQTKYKYDGMWAPEAFDVYRWVLADQILKLRVACMTK